MPQCERQSQSSHLFSTVPRQQISSNSQFFSLLSCFRHFVFLTKSRQSHWGLNVNCAKSHNPEKNNNNSTTTIATTTTITTQQQRQQQEEWKDEGRRKRKRRAEEVKATGTRTHILQRQPHVLDGLKVADLTAVDELRGQHSLLEGIPGHY